MEVKCTPKNKSMNCTLKKLYKPIDDYMFSYVIPSLFIITMIIYIIGLYIQTVLLESKQDWATNMCVPKYMFISGMINKIPGEDAIQTTYDNLQVTCRKCNLAKGVLTESEFTDRLRTRAMNILNRIGSEK